MGDLISLPTVHERLYDKLGYIVEGRISAMGHDPELAEKIRITAKRAFKEYGVRPDISVSFPLRNALPEHVEAVQKALKDISEQFYVNLNSLFSRVVRLEIEMCEYKHAVEKEKRVLRAIK